MNGSGRQEDTKDMEDAARVFGIVLISKPKPPPVFAVWPGANWETVQLFLGMQTQWERAGMDGTMTGLNYARLPVVAAGLRIRWRPLFERLQVMEYAALQELAKRRPTTAPAQP